ncbi:MAG: hypothetical protein Kow0047_26100 [Anaerolineae bacterium]
MNENRVTFGLIQYGIIVLTVATAVIHFSLLFPDVLFILNGLGYLALLVARYAPLDFLASYRATARWALMGYTALTVILWAVMGARTPIAYIDKIIEIALIVLLWREGQAES